MNKRPQLNWKLNDYIEANIEPPSVLESNPEKTEGQLMNESEVQTWFLDSYKTLTALKETHPELFNELKENFIKDLWYLCEIEIMDEEAVIQSLEDDLMK